MEKIYKSMKHVGAGSIAVGVLVMVVGISVGIVSIINGAKLLKAKSDITF